MPEWLPQIGSTLSAMVAFAALMWTIGRSLINMSHRARRDIEQQKITLQRELEKEKQKHFTQAIDGLKEEIKSLFSKVNNLTNNLGRYEERLKAFNFNMKNFVDSTEKRCDALEREIKVYEKQVETFLIEVRNLNRKRG